MTMPPLTPADVRRISNDAAHAMQRQPGQPMRMWIDTEFNDFQGPLISLGIVAEDNACFYTVLDCPNPSPWVARHVMPVLMTDPVSREVAQKHLQEFLQPYEAVHLIADWPEDIAHFCSFLITGPGTRIETPLLTMEVRRDIDSSQSLNPHNALADALAVRRAHFSLIQGA